MSSSRSPRGSNRVRTGRGFSSIISSIRGPYTFDANVYQQKKTLAEGMMDLALMSANANQLRYVLTAKEDIYRYISLILISLSFVLQVIIGIGLIWNIKYDISQEEHTEKANKTNNWTIIGIFMITVLNVVISSFGISPADCLQLSNNPELSINRYD
ncbi:ninjurin-2-like [Chelonus insularis]|uniref:ninjurin-2-like n=1 Tax=Chelonus insularis TaxID=460826 RepID=UPI0015896B95|nr:ninjurin-2-like [Chelonus insularis]